MHIESQDFFIEKNEKFSGADQMPWKTSKNPFPLQDLNGYDYTVIQIAVAFVMIIGISFLTKPPAKEEVRKWKDAGVFLEYLSFGANSGMGGFFRFQASKQ